MPPPNPLHGIGLLLRRHNGDFSFLGTCFALRSQHHFLTARHCVGSLAADEVAIAVPGVLAPVVAEAIAHHPTADVTVVRLPSEAPVAQVEPFWMGVPLRALGVDFMAFGYPESVSGDQAREPTPRLFKGHVQRFFDHTSYIGYHYRAVELSIPAPAGLSGGPVFGGSTVSVFGMVTENFQSWTTVEAVEEVREQGIVGATEYRAIVNYGVAILLNEESAWLDAHLPTFDSSDWVDRRHIPPGPTW
jgi:hypothetical protein